MIKFLFVFCYLGVSSDFQDDNQTTPAGLTLEERRRRLKFEEAPEQQTLLHSTYKRALSVAGLKNMITPIDEDKWEEEDMIKCRETSDDMCTCDLNNLIFLTKNIECHETCGFMVSRPTSCVKFCIRADMCRDFAVMQSWGNPDTGRCAVPCADDKYWDPDWHNKRATDKPGFVSGCRECAGIGDCLVCNNGLREQINILTNKMECISDWHGVMNICLAVAGSLVLVVICHVVMICCRKDINVDVVNHAMIFYDRSLPQYVDDRGVWVRYGYFTNLVTGNIGIAGIGTNTFFRFCKFSLTCYVFLALMLWVLTFFKNDHVTKCTETAIYKSALTRTMEFLRLDEEGEKEYVFNARNMSNPDSWEAPPTTAPPPPPPPEETLDPAAQDDTEIEGTGDPVVQDETQPQENTGTTKPDESAAGENQVSAEKSDENTDIVGRRLVVQEFQQYCNENGIQIPSSYGNHSAITPTLEYLQTTLRNNSNHTAHLRWNNRNFTIPETKREKKRDNLPTTPLSSILYPQELETNIKKAKKDDNIALPPIIALITRRLEVSLDLDDDEIRYYRIASGMIMLTYVIWFIASIIFVAQICTVVKWIDENMLTPKDFCVEMAGFPESATDPVEIENWLQETFPAVNLIGVSIAYDFGDYEDEIFRAVRHQITEMDKVSDLNLVDQTSTILTKHRMAHEEYHKAKLHEQKEMNNGDSSDAKIDTDYNPHAIKRLKDFVQDKLITRKDPPIQKSNKASLDHSWEPVKRVSTKNVFYDRNKYGELKRVEQVDFHDVASKAALLRDKVEYHHFDDSNEKRIYAGDDHAGEPPVKASHLTVGQIFRSANQKVADAFKIVKPTDERIFVKAQWVDTLLLKLLHNYDNAADPSRLDEWTEKDDKNIIDIIENLKSSGTIYVAFQTEEEANHVALVKSRNYQGDEIKIKKLTCEPTGITWGGHVKNRPIWRTLVQILFMLIGISLFLGSLTPALYLYIRAATIPGEEVNSLIDIFFGMIPVLATLLMCLLANFAADFRGYRKFAFRNDMVLSCSFILTLITVGSDCVLVVLLSVGQVFSGENSKVGRASFIESFTREMMAMAFPTYFFTVSFVPMFMEVILLPLLGYWMTRSRPIPLSVAETIMQPIENDIAFRYSDAITGLCLYLTLCPFDSPMAPSLVFMGAIVMGLHYISSHTVILKMSRWHLDDSETLVITAMHCWSVPMGILILSGSVWSYQVGDITETALWGYFCGHMIIYNATISIAFMTFKDWDRSPRLETFEYATKKLYKMGCCYNIFNTNWVLCLRNKYLAENHRGITDLITKESRIVPFMCGKEYLIPGVPTKQSRGSGLWQEFLTFLKFRVFYRFQSPHEKELFDKIQLLREKEREDYKRELKGKPPLHLAREDFQKIYDENDDDDFNQFMKTNDATHTFTKHTVHMGPAKQIMNEMGEFSDIPSTSERETSLKSSGRKLTGIDYIDKNITSEIPLGSSDENITPTKPLGLSRESSVLSLPKVTIQPKNSSPIMPKRPKELPPSPIKESVKEDELPSDRNNNNI